MWIMIVSFLSLDVQLMHDEDQDVIEGSRGDIARIWYWQVVRVKIIDRKFGLFFSGPPQKKMQVRIAIPILSHGHVCVSENVGDPIANGNFEGTYADI